MQARDRARHLEQVYQQRRGHNQHLSISDDDYHVTEAIGDMYDDDDPTPASPEYLRQNRPLSFMPSPLGDTISPSSRFGNAGRSPPRAHLQRQGSGERVPGINGVNGDARRAAMEGLEGQRFNAGSAGSSPPMLNRQPSDTATQPFEMSLDYSKPEDVAQELSNLQAIRRMSMDVNSQDPDLPSFNPSFRVPAVAPPTHGADEGDPSRLFWVPARLHPELAPKEFKTFIEDKVKTIKRTSAGEDNLLSPDGLSRQGSASSSLRRKKSMLSRQIDSGANYEDGAERLERQRSFSDRPEAGVGLKELETLVTDPSTLSRKISEEVHRESLDSGIEMSPANDDMPLFPGQGGPTLKRSTRTQYRRGSLRKGEKLPFSKRLAARQAGGATSETEDSPASSPNTDAPPVPQLPLTRVQTEPTPSSLASTIESFDFSRPGRKRAPVQSTPGFLGELDFGESTGGEGDFFREHRREQHVPPPQDDPNDHRSFHSRIASNPQTTAATIGAVPVPKIVETPPPDPSYPQPVQHPERKSSRSPTSSEPPPSLPPQQPLPNRPRMQHPQQQQPSRPGMQRHTSQQSPSQTFDDMTAHHSSIPGSSTRTDTLSIIPTMPDEKKADKKNKKDDSRKPSWGWLGSRGKDERDEREKKEEEASRRAKAKSPRPGDESSSGRLDVLQQQIDGNNRPRESLVLDRNSIHLEEARKKESNRKSGESAKKEKDGIFSSLFSSKKKDKDGSSKSSKQRGLSPEPPPRILKPDIDYNWTRFSIMEERAIYRMAHIKLANPRRELYSQVLLSNFMYSYLAKVQSQHPQLQMATGPTKQRPAPKKEQQRQQPSNQPEEFSQYQRYQQQQQEQQHHHQQSQQDSPQYHQSPPLTSEQQLEDGPMESRSDSRASQHTQYSMNHNQQQQQAPKQQQQQPYGSSNGHYGGGYGGHGAAPSNQGGPVNYLGGHASQRSEPLMNDQGDMW